MQAGGDPAAPPAPPAAAPSAPPPERLVARDTLRALINSVLREEVSPETEELLLDVGDDFLESVAHGAAQLARHRGGDTLEAADVALHLERVWGMSLPGHGAAGGGDAGAAQQLQQQQMGASPAHAARLAAVRRSMAAASAAAGAR